MLWALLCLQCVCKILRWVTTWCDAKIFITGYVWLAYCMLSYFQNKQHIDILDPHHSGKTKIHHELYTSLRRSMLHWFWRPGRNQNGEEESKSIIIRSQRFQLWRQLQLGYVDMKVWLLAHKTMNSKSAGVNKNIALFDGDSRKVGGYWW